MPFRNAPSRTIVTTILSSMVLLVALAGSAFGWQEQGHGGGATAFPRYTGPGGTPTGESPLTILGPSVIAGAGDTYRVCVASDGTTISAVAAGSNAVGQAPANETALFLFDRFGEGVIGSDNGPAPSPGSQLNLAGVQAGIYYLTIAQSNQEPVDAAGNQIFPGADQTNQPANPAAGPFVDTISTPPVGGAGGYTVDLVGFVSCDSDLEVTKTASPATIVGTAGGTLTYTINVKNNGPALSLDPRVTDTIPAGTTFGSATGGGWTCSPGPAVSCTRTQIPVGATRTITIVVNVPANAFPGGAIISNTATAAHPTVACVPPDQPAGQCPEFQDLVPTNNSSTATTPVLPAADLLLTKSCPGTAVAGLTGPTCTITVNNAAGAGSATAVVVTDTLPAGVSPATLSTSQGSCGFVAPTITCNLGTVAPNTTATITYGLVVPSGFTPTTITNNASVTTASAESSTRTNNASVTVPVARQQDILLDKSCTPGTVIAGNSFTCTVLVSNGGPSDASITLTDDFPDNFTPSNLTTTGPVCALQPTGTNLTCTPFLVVNGGSFQVSYTLTVPLSQPSAVVSNTATATGSGTEVGQRPNSETVQTTIINEADLAITKNCLPNPVASSGTATCTISVTNLGPAAAQNVMVSDTVPALTTYTGGSAGCTAGPVAAGGTVTCSLGLIAANGPATPVTLNFLIDEDLPATTTTNNVSVASTTPDPVSGNNTAQAPINIVPGCGGQIANKFGGAGNDTLQGTSGIDIIQGLGGNDNITGLAGDDKLCGGAGDDAVTGGDGADFLSGGSGNDRLTGIAGNDNMFGGTGNDNLTGGDGDDAHDGGDGTDICTGGAHVQGDTGIRCETVSTIP